MHARAETWRRLCAWPLARQSFMPVVRELAHGAIIEANLTGGTEGECFGIWPAWPCCKRRAAAMTALSAVARESHNANAR